MFASLAAAVVLGPADPLIDYVKKPDPAFAWRQVDGAYGFTELKLTSQVWQKITWKHDLVIATPKSGAKGDKAILFVTGDRGRSDLPIAQLLADRAGVEVAMLFNIPNQPLWGLKEDALIAKTFGEYLKSGDSTWPLLLPMTKSAVRGMDAVQAWSKGRIKSFLVTGASKRGWTTWLTGSVKDKRVAAIAPMVIDILNMPAQLKKQKEMFGGTFSEEIADYSSSGLTEALASEKGKVLTSIVDPYRHLKNVKKPVLIVVGGNDPYWTVDAHSVYWKDIKAPKLIRIVPNVGHGLGTGKEALASVAFFAKAVFGMIPGGLPKVTWTPGDVSESVSRSDSRYKGYESWVAVSDTLDFRKSNWMDASRVRIDGSKNRAQFLEYKFKSGQDEASFTSGAVVFRGQR